MASGRLDTWERHQELVSVGREAAQRKLSPSSLPERDRASSTRWSARNRAGGQRRPGLRWRGLRLSSPPRPRHSNRSRGMRADKGARAGAAGSRQQPRRFLFLAGAVVPAGPRYGPACFPVWAWPPPRARGLWSPHRGDQRLHPGSLGLADSAGKCGATADPGASWTPAFLPLTTPWRPSGGPPRAASQGRPALPPGPTGLLYQPARGLGPGSACACPATVLPGLSPGADPGAHSFSALGSPGPRQVLGVSASSGKNPKCCGQTTRGCVHSVSSPGESAGRAPQARPAELLGLGRLPPKIRGVTLRQARRRRVLTPP